MPNEPLEIGLDLITRIDNATRSQDCANELQSIYFNHYEYANATKMADKEWPAVFEIESSFLIIQPSMRIANSMPKFKPSTTSLGSEASSKRQEKEPLKTSWTLLSRPGKTTSRFWKDRVNR